MVRINSHGSRRGFFFFLSIAEAFALVLLKEQQHASPPISMLGEVALPPLLPHSIVAHICTSGEGGFLGFSLIFLKPALL